MDRQKKLRRNVLLLRTIKAFDMAMITIPIIVIYYIDHGLSMADVMWLQAIFGATMIVIEIPSGYFSDVLGRKRTMIIGSTLLTVGWGLYAFAHSFETFLLAELVLGVGVAFLSGTDSAMLYDTLLELGEEHTGVYQEGRMLAMGNFSEAGAAVLGGFLATYSLTLPFYVQALIMLPVIPVSLLLLEPSRHVEHGTKTGMRDIWDTVARVVHHDRRLRWMLLTASLLGACTLTILWMYQPLWKEIGVPVALFGVIWAGGNTLVGIASLRAASLGQRFGEKRIIGYIIGAVVVSCFAIGFFPSLWLMPLFAVFYLSRGVSHPIFTSRINKRVDSSRRATVLSVRQLGVRALFVGLAPLIGAIGDAESLPTAFVASGLIFGSTMIFAYIVWLKAVRQGRDTSNVIAL